MSGKYYILRFPELQTWAKLWIPHKHLWWRTRYSLTYHRSKDSLKALNKQSSKFNCSSKESLSLSVFFYNYFYLSLAFQDSKEFFTVFYLSQVAIFYSLHFTPWVSKKTRKKIDTIFYNSSWTKDVYIIMQYINGCDESK